MESTTWDTFFCKLIVIEALATDLVAGAWYVLPPWWDHQHLSLSTTLKASECAHQARPTAATVPSNRAQAQPQKQRYSATQPRIILSSFTKTFKLKSHGH